MVDSQDHAVSRGLAGLFVLALVASTAFGVSGLIGPAPEDLPAQDPLPFDPPSEAEIAVAARTALADPEVHENLGDRHVFLGAALRTEKRPGVPVPEHQRLFDVWFYDYGSDDVVWAVVHPVEKRVTQVVPVDFPFQPPLAGVEIGRAVELAFDLDATHVRFPDGPLPATAVLVAGEGTACPVNRCALLGFIEEDGPAMDFLVLVNLSQDQVIKVIQGGWQEVYHA